MAPHDSLEPHAMLLSFLYKLCIPLASSAGIICKLSAPVGFAEFRVEACLFLFLPSSLLEVEEGESKRQLGSCITRTRTQSKATQTDTDTDGGGGEGGRGRLLLRKETWAHPNHFPMSKGDDPNNTLFPVPFALRPLMDGYNFPNNLDCFVPFFTRQQRVREGERERGAQQFGPPLSSPPLS